MQNPLETRSKERELSIEVEIRRNSENYQPGEVMLCAGRKKRWSRFFKDGNELVGFLQTLTNSYHLSSRTISYKTKKDKTIFVLSINDGPKTQDFIDIGGILGLV